MDVKDYRMAPKSTMGFHIDWKNQKLDPGKYTLKLHAEAGKQNWNREKEFVIPGKEAKDLNKEAVEVTNTKDYTWYVIISLSFIILILVYVIFRLMRKNKQQNFKR